MSHSSKKIVASKASIHADEFTRPGKIRQTSAHHAFKTTARGDVKVIIKEQYPRQDTDSERPPEGNRHKRRFRGDLLDDLRYDDLHLSAIPGPRVHRITYSQSNHPIFYYISFHETFG